MPTAGSCSKMLAEIREQPEVLIKVLENNTRTIQWISNDLLPMIKSRDIDNVIIAARGSSDNAAILGKYIIETLLGLPVSPAALSVVNLYRANLSLDRSIVIGISQSGETNEIIDFMSNIKPYAGYSLSITNNPQSELANMGLDANLFCHAGIEQALAATKSFSATLMNFYLLAVLLHPNASELKKELETVPMLVNEVLLMEEEVVKNCSSLAQKDECIVLARGYNYPVALEAGLKLQETTYIRAKAYSGADFQHGPIAITEKGMHFLAFLPDGPSYPGMKWLCEKVSERGGELLTISSKKVQDSVIKGVRQITTPAVSEWLSPFVFTVFAQLLAYYAAQERGVDPDHPRWLKKVTDTV